jgi:hypothetical protein
VTEVGTGHVRGARPAPPPARAGRPDGRRPGLAARHHPRGMARDMGGGMQVYVMRPGLRGRREDLLKTLDGASPGQIAKVDEQRAFAEAWRAGLGK